MKVKLIKPLPQIGKVVPAGVILADAPEALMEKLVRQGRAVWVEKQAGAGVDPPPAPLPTSVVMEKVDTVPDIVTPDEKPHEEQPVKKAEEKKSARASARPKRKKGDV